MNDLDKCQDNTIYPNLISPEIFCDHMVKFWELAFDVEITLTSKPNSVLLLSAENDEGGSRILANLMYDISSTPILIKTAPPLPGYVNSKTLIIAHSSTGIDSDIIYYIEEGIKRNANVLCITPKGTVANYAASVKIPLLIIPDAFVIYAQKNYIFIPMLAALEKARIISDHSKELIDALCMLRKRVIQYSINTNWEENDALILSQQLGGRRILLVGANNITDDIAFCLYQQLLQSLEGLQLEWDTLPDLQRGGLTISLLNVQQQLLVILLRSEEENPGIIEKFQELKYILLKKGAEVEEIFARGGSRIERTLYFLTLSDFIVAYLKQFHHENGIFNRPN